MAARGLSLVGHAGRGNFGSASLILIAVSCIRYTYHALIVVVLIVTNLLTYCVLFA